MTGKSRPPPPDRPACPAMSEEARQSKIAAAKKKLRDYQQRNNSPTGLKKKKKKTKHGTSPKKTTSDGCVAPQDIQDILNVLVSNLTYSSGVALSPLDKRKVSNEPEILLSVPTDDDTKSPGVTARSNNSDIASAQNCDAGCDWSVRDNIKDLGQLCHELNGLVSESRYQELATALDASNRANKHLTRKIKELEKQNQKHLNQLEKMRTMKAEKHHSLRRVQELETDLAQLKSQTAAPPAPEPPAGPSEKHQQLGSDAQLLQKELETLTNRLRSTIQENIELTLSNQEQSRQLRRLERMAQSWKEDAESRTKVLEEIKNSRTTISRALCQNLELKKQLAELQDGFVKMSNASMEKTSLLISEQHTNSQLTKKLGVLQEKLAALADKIEEKSRESQELRQQRDQYLSQLRQQVAASQRLASARDDLEKQVQLLEQLQQKSESHTEQVGRKLQETQRHLETVNEQNQQLQAELKLLTVTAEGEGLNMEDEASQPTLRVPEDLDGRECIVAFCNSALASAEQEQVHLRRELREQKLLCQRLANLAAALEHQREEVEAAAASQRRTDSVSGETHQALREAMEKLQGRFTDLIEEKADLRERVEELEHRCVQLSEETDTIGEYIVLYQRQRALMRKRQREKEECLSQLASEKEEMKEKLSALQQLVVQLLEERKEHHEKVPVGKQSPAAEAPIAPPAHQEVGAAKAQVSPDTSGQPAQGAPGQTPAPAAQQSSSTKSRAPEPVSLSPRCPVFHFSIGLMTMLTS